MVGKEIQNVDFRFAAFKKGRWKSYTRFDGLPGNEVRAIHQEYRRYDVVWDEQRHLPLRWREV